MRRKAIRDVRRDIRPDLEHDLVAVVQDERTGITAAANAADVDAHGAGEREQAIPRELHPPHAEERPERRPALELHDAGRLDGPHPGAAARAAHAAELEACSADADRCGDDHDSAVREELDVRTRARTERARRTRRMDSGTRVVPRSDADRRRHGLKHLVHGIAVLAVLGLAGCGGGSSGGPTIAIQPAGQYKLVTRIEGAVAAGKPITITYSILQPDGRNLTQFKRGPGPHTGVHVIYVRNDLGAIVHHHPPIAANGTFTDTVDFALGGPYRVVIDVYPAQTTPQPNFQLFTRVHVIGKYTPRPLPLPSSSQTVDGYRFALKGVPHLRPIQATLLDFTVTAPNGKPATFTPWYGALAHAIFFHEGSLEYFHTHVCAPGAPNCTSLLGGAKVTGTSSTPGELSVGVLVPDAGTWRLFLQCRVGGHVLTAPFTLQVK